MISFFIISVLNFYAVFNCTVNNTLIDDSVHLIGRCHDAYTAEILIVKGTVQTNTGEFFSIQSDELGLIESQIPITSKYITFESVGYRKKTLPINFINNPKENQKFRISLTMSKVDSAETPKESNLLLAFSIVDSVQTKYEILSIGNPKTYRSLNLRPGTTPSNFSFNGFNRLGDYEFRATTMNGDTLISKKINIKQGLNFMSVYVDRADISNMPYNKTLNQKSINNKEFFLLFEQSSFQLTNLNQMTLDSVSEILKRNDGLSANITGHTDNIGKEELNITLSEFRARTTARYLRQKGVLEKQIKLYWKGSTEMKIFDNAVERKENRRVEIKIIDE